MLQLQLGDVGIIVLEPENIRRVQAGNPIHVPLEQFTNIRILAIYYSPDVEWLGEAISNHIALRGDPREIPKLITESAKRSEPPLRPSHPPLFFAGGDNSGNA